MTIIKLDPNDLFRYVVGNTLRDPIEACIDSENRYEVFDSGIFDHTTKQILIQDSSFVDFCTAVSELKSIVGQLSTEEIISRCKDFSSISIKINLG